MAGRSGFLQVLVFVGQYGGLRFLQILLDLVSVIVHLDLGWEQGGHGDEFQIRVTDQLAGQPQERLLEVVVGLGRDVVVLKEEESSGLVLMLIFLD